MARIRGILGGVALVAGLLYPIVDAAPASAADGALDTLYGTNGVATLAPTQANAILAASAMVTDAAGRTTLVGNPRAVGPSTPVIGRVLANGAFDPAFGTNGVATLGIFATAVDDRPAGGVIVLGANGELRAFTDAGIVDGSFVTAVPGLTTGQTPSALAVATDGSVLVAGSQDVAGETRAWAVRLDGTTGALLQSWNLDGTAALVGTPTRVATLADGSPVALADGTTLQWFAAASTTALDASLFATALGVDSADRVVAAGVANGSLALTRVSSSTKAVDPGFAGGALLDFGTSADGTGAVLFASGDRPIALGALSGTSMIVARATAAGQADGTFGTGGVLATLLPDLVTSRSGGAASGSVAADGAIRIGGAAGLLPFVARVTSAGALDPALNGTGVRWLDSIGPFGATSFRPVGLAAVGRDGSIVGTAQDPQGVRVIKLTPAGARDTSFGRNGEFAIRTLSGGLTTTDSSGRVIVAAATGTGQWYVLRLTATGAVDTSFGTGGVVSFTTPAAPVALATTAGDAVVIVVSGAGAAGIVRLTSSGALDPGFGSGGRVALANANRAAILPDGSTAVIETATSGHRYSATGTVGAAFSVSGMSLVDVDVDSTGRVVATGSLSAGATPVVVRFTATGALDTTFGASGVRGLATPGTAARLVVDAFDRPYALVTLSGTGSRIDRLTTSGALDTSFASSGSLSLTGSGAISPGDLAFDSSGRLVAAGFFPSVADVRGVRLVAATAPPADTTGPTITITQPVDGAQYEVGQPRSAAYTCVDPSAPVSCTGTVTLPGPFDVSSIGTKTFTVNARDGLGNTSTKTVTYRVADTFAPFITPVNPTNGQLIPRNSVVNITVSCVDPFQGASGLATCTSSPSGLLDTSTLGPRTITYTATDRAGNSRTQSITVQIVDRTPPTISIASPAGEYLLTDNVLADYTCADEAGGSGVASCVGDTPNGQAIATSVPGNFTFRVSATDVAGNSANTTSNYVIYDRNFGTITRGNAITTGELTTTTDPIETTVVAGSTGDFAIVERPVEAPAGWRTVTFASIVTAPEATTAKPHTVTLRIDTSVMDQLNLLNVQILAGGRVIPQCGNGNGAVPDPCITSRAPGGASSDITILTSKGATFIPVLASVPVPITSVSQPVQPTTITATNRTFGVTYTFGAAPGKDALTNVYVSELYSCNGDVAFYTPSTPLPFDFSGRQTTWRFEYQAPPSARGLCRQVIVAWSDGRTDRFNVQF